MTNKNDKKFPFDLRFQLKILSMLLMNDELCKQHVSYIQPDYFGNPIHKEIFIRISDFYAKYKRAPGVDEIWEEIKIIKEKDTRIPDKEADHITLKMLDMVQEGDFDYISDSVLDFVRNQAVFNALKDAGEKHYPKGDYDKILFDIKKASSTGIEIKHNPESIDGFLSQTIIPRERFCENWAERNALSIISGEPKVGKSLLIMNLLLKMARGEDFLDFKVEKPVRSLYVQQEIAKDSMKDRLDKMRGITNPTVYKDLYLVNTIGDILKINNSSHRFKICEFIEDIEPDLVVFDPLSTFHSKNENDAQQMNEVLDYFFEMKERYHIAIILIHHFGKPTQVERSGGHLPRGHSVLGDRPDIIINVKEIPKKYKSEDVHLPMNYHNYAEISFVLRSNFPYDNIVVERNESLWFERSDIYRYYGKKLTPEKIKKLIIENGERTGDVFKMEQKKLMDLLLEDCSRPIAFKYLKEARQKGLIQESTLEKKGQPKILSVKM